MRRTSKVIIESALVVLIVITQPLSIVNAVAAKIGSPCSVRDANTTVNGKMLHCAVIPSKWSTTTQMVWQDANQWSSNVDKVTASLGVKERYQYCLVQNGAPLPGKSGAVPANALIACQGLPGAPKPANSNGSTSSGGSASNSPWPPFITQDYLKCLSKSGFNPKNMNELMQALSRKSQTVAFNSCKSIEPKFVSDFSSTNH
jgi:hypothetical protein